MIITRLDGNEFDVTCLGCDLQNQKKLAFGGMILETQSFYVAQDFELPIEGFFIVSLKEHKKFFTDLSREQRIELFDIVYQLETILKEIGICEAVNLVGMEKHEHFHFWVMPVHEWMKEKFKKTISNFGQIADYAKNNLRTQEQFDNILKVINLTKEKLQK